MKVCVMIKLVEQNVSVESIIYQVTAGRSSAPHHNFWNALNVLTLLDQNLSHAPNFSNGGAQVST